MKRNQIRKSEWSKIDYKSGMGGFLNPPTHPEHTKSVRSVYGDTFSMSLSSAVESDWLEDETRSDVKAILNTWKAPAIDSPEVQDWILRVMGYFKDCYQGDNGSWNASDLHIDKDGTDSRSIDKHAGVHLIRQYYPDFTPTAEHFKNAYWGKKGA